MTELKPDEPAHAAPRAQEAADTAGDDPGPGPRPLTDAARRALAEAEERRRAQANDNAGPPEIGGRGGLDPVRFGDWEKDGLTSDF